MELVEQHLGYSNPIQPSDIYTLVETSGSHHQHDREVARPYCPFNTEPGYIIENGRIS